MYLQIFGSTWWRRFLKSRKEGTFGISNVPYASSTLGKNPPAGYYSPGKNLRCKFGGRIPCRSVCSLVAGGCCVKIDWHHVRMCATSSSRVLRQLPEVFQSQKPAETWAHYTVLTADSTSEKKSAGNIKIFWSLWIAPGNYRRLKIGGKRVRTLGRKPQPTGKKVVGWKSAGEML
jgi:hypothetical protein